MHQMEIESVGTFEVAYKPNNPDVKVVVSTAGWSETVPVMADPAWASDERVSEMLKKVILFAQTQGSTGGTLMLGRGNLVEIRLIDSSGQKQYRIDSWEKRSEVCTAIGRCRIALQSKDEAE